MFFCTLGGGYIEKFDDEASKFEHFANKYVDKSEDNS